MRGFLKAAAVYLIAVISSGLLIAFSMPPHDIWWLAFFSLVPLLLLVRKLSPFTAFGTGILAVAVAGIVLSGRIEDGIHLAYLIAAFGCLSLTVGLPLFMISLYKKSGTAVRIAFTAASGVAAEWVFSHLFAVSLAISQHANPAALKLSSYTGYWGVTFVIWAFSALTAAIITRRKGVTIPAIVLAALILILSIDTYNHKETKPGITVAAFQTPDICVLLDSTDSIEPKPAIAVWTENGLSPGNTNVLECARRNGIYIAANYMERGEVKSGNVSCLISPEGKVIGRFNKRHLFGNENINYKKPMKPDKPVPISSETTIAIPTCYDTMFTDTVRNYVRDGANLILVPNHDPPTPNSLFALMHMGMTAFRAAENNVPLVVADVMSKSVVLDSRGWVIAQSEPHTTCVITASVSPGGSRTLFNRIGDLFAYLCIGFTIAVPVLQKLRRN